MSTPTEPEHRPKTILITGAGRRLGAAMARGFHGRGDRVLVHYRSSGAEASALAAELNEARPDSAATLSADLDDLTSVQALADSAAERWGPVELLINNASAFFPTPLGSVSETDWDRLHNSNLKGPFFLTQALLPQLRQQRGAVINLLDIHGTRPLARFSVYASAKAGLGMLTASMALELAPEVRVNGIAPGAILWPEEEGDSASKQARLAKIPLGRLGGEAAVVGAALYLADADYVTGEVLTVDGGRQLVS